MIEDCKTNHNSSAITLMEMLVKFFTKQSMNIELAIHGQGKFDLVSHIPLLLRDRMETALSDVVQVCVVNFLHCSKASSIAAFAFAGKLDVLCTISSVKAEMYKVVAQQIMIDSHKEETLPVVMVYDSVTSSKASWWTIQTNDNAWTTTRCSCSVFSSRKLCVHVVLACQKVGIDTYLKSYSKLFKPSAMQIIQTEQKKFKSHAGRKGAKPCYGNKKCKDHRLAHEKALCIFDNFDDYGDALFELDGDSEDEMEKYLEEGEVDTAFLGN